VVEAKVGVWADSVVAHPPATPEAPATAMAVDGKTLRGSKKQGAPGPHLFSVVAHRLGLTRTQQAVAAKTHESKEVETVLRQSVRAGRGTHLRRDTVIPQWFQASKAAAASDGHAVHC
jgi:hypothetical protein